MADSKSWKQGIKSITMYLTKLGKDRLWVVVAYGLFATKRS